MNRSNLYNFSVAFTLFLLVFVIGLTFNSFYFGNPAPSYIQKLFSLTTNATFIQDVITVEGVFIGLSIPISVQVVSNITKDYDGEIASLLTDEFLYKSQYLLFLVSIMFGILFRFIGISSPYLLVIYFVWSIINILVFWRFMIRINQYVTNIEGVISQKLRDHAESIF